MKFNKIINNNDKNIKVQYENTCKGITLISLVFTIIVLLILAGVSMRALIGNNSVFKHASQAKDETEKAKELEHVQIVVGSARIYSVNNELTTNNLQEIFQKNGLNGTLTEDEEGNWIYTGNKNTYMIDKQCNVFAVKNNFIIYGNEKNILPAGYQQVEFLENTGTQYINTELTTINSLWAQLDLVPTGSGTYCLCSANDWSVSNWMGRNYLTFYGSSNTMEVGWRTYTKIQIQEQLNKRNMYELKLKSGDSFVKIENDLVWTSNDYLSDLNSPQKILLLCNTYNINGLPLHFLPCKLYSAKLLDDNGDIIWDGIPALDSVGRPCMYDTLTNEPFYNQGKNEFLYGTKVENYVGNKNNEEKYEIPITLKTTYGEKNIKITLDEPLRKLEDKADYLDLANKKVVRYIKRDSETGGVSLLDTPKEEEIEMEDIDFNKITSIKVNTDIEPNRIVEL